MKNSTALCFIIILFTFFSCKKTPDSLSGTLINKVKIYSEDITFNGYHQHNTFLVTYNNNNLLSSIIDSANPGNKSLYNYGAGYFTLDDYTNNKVTIAGRYFLNNNSQIDSSFQVNDTRDTSTEKYFYNGNNQLVRVNFYEYSGSQGILLSDVSTYTFDNNGLVISNRNNSGYTNYDYYPDLKNTLTFYTVPVGTPPPYLIKNESSTMSGTLITGIHTYKFDSTNRLTEDRFTLDNNNGIFIKTYQY